MDVDEDLIAGVLAVNPGTPPAPARPGGPAASPTASGHPGPYGEYVG
ncbi:hypothetical protein MXD62_13235 [Frankia sp. Mgl5]|nr:hypothetical protein [Frankia sp. Mgl5]MCK9928125.1 hypothetical protein [Frankia sp. Mgl5]